MGGEMETSEPLIDQKLMVDAASLADMDDTVLAHAVRRFHHESESADTYDPIAAFGAFNQHSSSPW